MGSTKTTLESCARLISRYDSSSPRTTSGPVLAATPPPSAGRCSRPAASRDPVGPTAAGVAAELLATPDRAAHLVEHVMIARRVSEYDWPCLRAARERCQQRRGLSPLSPTQVIGSRIAGPPADRLLEQPRRLLRQRSDRRRDVVFDEDHAGRAPREHGLVVVTDMAIGPLSVESGPRSPTRGGLFAQAAM